MPGSYEPDPNGTPAQHELARYLELTRGRRDSWEEVYRGLVLEQLVPPPPISWTRQLLGACADLYHSHVVVADGRQLTRDDLQGVPPYIFLEYLVKHRAYLAHGSNRTDIDLFTPRAAGDTYEGGAVPKVYAASSGIMAMFFAILDRKRLWELPCVPATNVLFASWVEAGQKREGHWFVIDHRALRHAPWQVGAVYLLPRGPFTAEYKEMQWFSLSAVRPAARILVGPDDFPLLHEVRGIDWFEDAARGLEGAPFRGDAILYPLENGRVGATERP